MTSRVYLRFYSLPDKSLGLLCVRFGGGKHAVPLKDPVKFAKTVIAVEVIYSLAIAAVKLSILIPVPSPLPQLPLPDYTLVSRRVYPLLHCQQYLGVHLRMPAGRSSLGAFREGELHSL